MKKINQQLDLVNAYHMVRQSLRRDNVDARVPYWFALALRTMISLDEKGATFFIREIVNRDNIAIWLTSHTTEETHPILSLIEKAQILEWLLL